MFLKKAQKRVSVAFVRQADTAAAKDMPVWKTCEFRRLGKVRLSQKRSNYKYGCFKLGTA